MFDDIFSGLAHHALEPQPGGDHLAAADPFAGAFGHHDLWAHHHDPAATLPHHDLAAAATAHAAPAAPVAPVHHQDIADHLISDILGGEPVPTVTTWDPNSFHGIGNPVGDEKYWQEQHTNDCAVMAQADVYAALTGHTLTEDQALQIVTSHGWYHDGTTLEDTGKLLDYLGIHTTQHTDASLQDIATAMQNGEQVIVGLNANEIWFPYHDSATGQPIEQAVAGHAVWVTGIDQEPDGSVKIILSDTGTPNGNAEAVDAADFMNAWHDFGNFMVTTPATQAAA